jgi:hypothetical protein
MTVSKSSALIIMMTSVAGGAGVVHQNVDPAELIDRGLDERVGGFLADISLHGQRAAADCR